MGSPMADCVVDSQLARTIAAKATIATARMGLLKLTERTDRFARSSIGRPKLTLGCLARLRGERIRLFENPDHVERLVVTDGVVNREVQIGERTIVPPLDQIATARRGRQGSHARESGPSIET